MLPETNRPDNLTESGTANNVTIQIDKTNDEYTSGGETVKVFLENDNPVFPYTRYKHKVKGGGTTNYKKMTSPTFKNGETSINISVTGDVHAVYVFYFGDRPIIICVAIGTTTPDEWKYYTPEDKLYNPYADMTKWKDITNATGTAVTGKIRKTLPPNSTNQDLKDVLRDLTGELIGMSFLIMISIIFVSIMIGLIISKSLKRNPNFWGNY